MPAFLGVVSSGSNSGRYIRSFYSGLFIHNGSYIKTKILMELGNVNFRSHGAPIHDPPTAMVGTSQRTYQGR